jgi:Predicted transcriptional regulators
MEHDSAGPVTPTQAVARRVRETRKRRGWSAERLAAEMTRVGIPWERAVVTKLETGRRAAVSVAELLALGYVLDVAPVHLLIPLDSLEGYRIVPNSGVQAGRAREWVRGFWPLSSTDKRIYYTEIPADELTPPTHQPIPVDSAPQRQALLAELERRGFGDLRFESEEDSNRG